MSEKSQTILTVENDDDVRSIIVDIVESLGFKCIEATNARSALAILEIEIIDLILLDMHMPNTKGNQLLKYIRERGFVTPVIVVSGFLQKDVIREVSALGVVAILSKPTRIKRFSEEILKVLQPEAIP
jgi:two-component system response regulator